jgi:hypothetical protein
MQFVFCSAFQFDQVDNFYKLENFICIKSCICEKSTFCLLPLGGLKYQKVTALGRTFSESDCKDITFSLIEKWNIKNWRVVFFKPCCQRWMSDQLQHI